MDESKEELIKEDSDSIEGAGGKKKRIKKRKSKEERSKDRRVVGTVFLMMLLVTLFFYLWPRIKTGRLEMPKINFNIGDWRVETPGWKGYSESKL